MNALEQLLHKVSDLMAGKKLSWALIGGLAVSVRTEPRFTRDLVQAINRAWNEFGNP